MANEWISVKDRLPEEHDAYLCAEWSKTFNEYFIHIRYFAKDLYEWDRFSFPDGKGKGGFYWSDREWGCGLADDVTHWMPLPEPPSSTISKTETVDKKRSANDGK